MYVGLVRMKHNCHKSMYVKRSYKHLHNKQGQDSKHLHTHQKQDSYCDRRVHVECSEYSNESSYLCDECKAQVSYNKARYYSIRKTINESKN